MEVKERVVAGGYVEISFTLPREKAREVARRYLDGCSQGDYDTCLAHWYVTDDDQINFTMRRLLPVIELTDSEGLRVINSKSTKANSPTPS